MIPFAFSILAGRSPAPMKEARLDLRYRRLSPRRAVGRLPVVESTSCRHHDEQRKIRNVGPRASSESRAARTRAVTCNQLMKHRGGKEEITIVCS